MKNRNIILTAAQISGNVPSDYDMDFDEMAFLQNYANDNLAGAITMAFNYGFVLGARAEANGKNIAKNVNKSAV